MPTTKNSECFLRPLRYSSSQSSITQSSIRTASTMYTSSILWNVTLHALQYRSFKRFLLRPLQFIILRRVQLLVRLNTVRLLNKILVGVWLNEILDRTPLPERELLLCELLLCEVVRETSKFLSYKF